MSLLAAAGGWRSLLQQRVPTFDTLTVNDLQVRYRQEHRGLRRGIALIINHLPNHVRQNWVKEALTNKLTDRGWSVALITPPSSPPQKWLPAVLDALAKIETRPIDAIWLQPSPNWLEKEFAESRIRCHVVLWVKPEAIQIKPEQRWVPQKPTLFLLTMEDAPPEWLLRQIQLAKTAGFPLSVTYWPLVDPEPDNDNLIARRISGWLVRKHSPSVKRPFFSSANQ